MSTAIPDLDSVRDVLRDWCSDEDALDRLAARHVRARADGSLRVLYVVPGPGGQVARLTARRASPAEGHRLEGELNRRAATGAGAPAVRGFVPELCLELFSHLPGVRLFTLVETPAFPRLCSRVGAALHELHQLSIDLDARRDPAEDVAADRLPVRAATQCFLNAYQCVRRPEDPERLEDAKIMLRACEHVLERGLA